MPKLSHKDSLNLAIDGLIIKLMVDLQAIMRDHVRAALQETLGKPLYTPPSRRLPPKKQATKAEVMQLPSLPPANNLARP